MNASTFTARVITSTGADVAAAFSGAIGAMSGPLHGGAPSRVLGMIEEVEKTGDAAAYVKGLLDNGERLMGFGHRVYRAEDPRARVLRRTAKELDAPRYEVAEALEKAALAELKERRPDRVLETNVEFWAAIVLDFAEVPPHMFTSMFTCARTGGWSAHILEQKRTGRLIRPSAMYSGPAPRKADDGRGLADRLGLSGLEPRDCVPRWTSGRFLTESPGLVQQCSGVRTGTSEEPCTLQIDVERREGYDGPQPPGRDRLRHRAPAQGRDHRAPWSAGTSTWSSTCWPSTSSSRPASAR